MYGSSDDFNQNLRDKADKSGGPFDMKSQVNMQIVDEADENDDNDMNRPSFFDSLKMSYTTTARPPQPQNQRNNLSKFNKTSTVTPNAQLPSP